MPVRKGAMLTAARTPPISSNLPERREQQRSNSRGCAGPGWSAVGAEHITKSAQSSGAAVLFSKFHRFSPEGVTGVLVLAESHISIHTWPEHSYAALDVFMCGRARPKEAIAVLQEFKPTHVVEYLLARGRANNAEQDRQPDRIDSERWLKGLDR
ncbi:adenosylmethionine decarboxylase [Mesorhizobium sp.]|uniref:adenosylmethionine decarboxylase n=1 Tax=Mesorhizobium sp. TaxID=1871066 RepID=UPI0012182578|nr:MAG: adenosylmethionine decarboxylase [Mesorhizobium sp.]